MGKWWGTWRRLQVCATGGCISWPREVATVEAFSLCGTGVQIYNQWYEFRDEVQAPDTCCCNQSCGPASLLDRNPSPQFIDTDCPVKVRIYPVLPSDAGRRVLLQGFDTIGNPIRTLDGTTWVDGEYLTLGGTATTSKKTFAPSGLTGVQKPITNGRLNVFGVDENGNETKIAIWEPSEVTPMYRRSYLADFSCCCTANVEAIVRLELIPALVDSDWLFISSIAAIKHMMKAIQREDRNQYQEAEREIQLALRALRNQEEKYSPQKGMRVNVEIHGTARPAFAFNGFN